PFIDLDRTMDAGPGLLDRAYNPRPTFHLLRHLNTLLFHAGVGDNMRDSSPIAIATAETHHSLQWQQQGRQMLLLLPAAAEPQGLPSSIRAEIAATTERIDLLSGRRRPTSAEDGGAITEPTLFYGTIG
ncbi:MAG: hypothetical protein KDE53_02145, partial [Caldilineaceae bacterium]|nr:hypothetical protein [Caldilineaceae bacterium]